MTDVVLYSQVAPLHVALYEGQVTGLLGPNGAGKSTTIAMLTGLTPPSGGDAIVAGHSLLGSLADCRRCLGVCPQQNVLFPALTCAEHLRIFAVLKGVPSRDVNREISKKLREVGLEQKGDARASTLSGGMKRRLQMAMALIGPSKVVLLDEPTSGLDPQVQARRLEAHTRGGEGTVRGFNHALPGRGGLALRQGLRDQRREVAVRRFASVSEEHARRQIRADADLRRRSRVHKQGQHRSARQRGVAFGSEVRRGCRFEPREGGRGDG